MKITDKMRLDWLDKSQGFKNPPGKSWIFHWTTKASLRQAIDAAIRASRAKGRRRR